MVEAGGRVSQAMQAFRTFLGESDMLAYLAMMAPRLVELWRVLKPTGSLYLHCDPTTSHYLKMLLDAVFGPVNFRSEIIWRRSSGHNKVSRQYGPIHDTILFYAKTDAAYFSPGVTPVTRGYVREWFTSEDERGPFRTNMLTGPGTRTGMSGQPWRKFDPTSVGRHWAIPASLRQVLRCLHRSLLIRQPVSEPTASSASTARLRQIPWAGRSRTRARRPQRYVA